MICDDVEIDFPAKKLRQGNCNDVQLHISQKSYGQASQHKSKHISIQLLAAKHTHFTFHISWQFDGAYRRPMDAIFHKWFTQQSLLICFKERTTFKNADKGLDVFLLSVRSM